MDMDKIKHVGLAAAFESGRILLSKFGNISSIEKKGRIDLVTDADTASEKAVIDIIHSSFPDHTILAEEEGFLKGDDRYRWIIDPLDGTTNFAHGLPIFSTSIAFAENGVIKFGVVNNPVMGELFTAVEGGGSYFNGKKISVSGKKTLTDCLLVTGFPYNYKETMDAIMTRFGRCLDATQGVRRLGSAAIDLCYVACGRFDGYWEQNLKPWDTAAGQLIAREAGATVTDFSNTPFDIGMQEILATNSFIHGDMLSLLRL
jgi:myo-inositol-1(or 4)-monophosphatase